mmetsp:Transcript_88704/g.206438  ORF Transcript_88704/g.206438 Transcript_88704/m.206438 type:complete len:204 (+) Transcript_88704:852-1463(+)
MTVPLMGCSSGKRPSRRCTCLASSSVFRKCVGSTAPFAGTSRSFCSSSLCPVCMASRRVSSTALCPESCPCKVRICASRTSDSPLTFSLTEASSSSFTCRATSFCSCSSVRNLAFTGARACSTSLMNSLSAAVSASSFVASSAMRLSSAWRSAFSLRPSFSMSCCCASTRCRIEFSSSSQMRRRAPKSSLCCAMSRWALWTFS